MFKFEISDKVFVDYFDSIAIVKDRKVRHIVDQPEVLYLLEFKSHFEPTWIDQRYIIHYFDSGETISEICNAIHGTEEDKQYKEEYIRTFNDDYKSFINQEFK